MTRHFDVCIRGGGITGRTLALLLAKERLRVGLVARDVSPAAVEVDASVDANVDVRAYALNLKSKQLLESVRCWPDAAHATPVMTMQVRGDDGGEVIFKAADTQAEALAWIVDVPVLEAMLAQATSFQPQIEMLETPQPATLTVVCEGKASAARAEFGVEFDVAPYSQCAIAARLRCEKPHAQTARQWFAQDEILGVLPLGTGSVAESAAGENEVAIVWSVPHEHARQLLEMTPADFASAVQVASHDSLGKVSLSSERVMWPLQLAHTEHWIGQTTVDGKGQAWALAGDAAHTVHPLSGQGLNLGLGDVAELATLIAKRDYWRSVADEKLLRRYQRSRKAESALLANTTDGLQRLFSQTGGNWQTLRNLGMNGFERSGPLKNWIARRAMGAS